MPKWLVMAGLIFVAYAGFGVLADYLPVDFWQTDSQILNGEETATYYKVVGTEGRDGYFLAAFIVGVCLIVIGKILHANVGR